MASPKISIIVAVYNAENTILKCLDSISQQTFEDFEVIMVDDGSLDHSGEKIDEYASRDSRFKAFHKSNGGVSSARQFGIDHASGEYSIHVDPDDWIAPGMLASLYAQAGKADMVICDFYINSYKGQEYVEQQPQNVEDNMAVIKDLFGHLHGSTCNKLIRLSCYSQFNVRFPEQISFCEDQYVVISLLLNPIRVTYLPKAFYHYVRGNEESLSKSYSSKMLEQDKCALTLFTSLVAHTPMRDFVEAHKAYFMMEHAFWWGANYFSSKAFKKEFYSYYPLLKRVIMPKTERILLNLSCRGFYSVTRKVIGMLMAVKHHIYNLTKK